jgi:hypothetical protein
LCCRHDTRKKRMFVNMGWRKGESRVVVAVENG